MPAISSPLVSVIVPIFNSGKYLAETIESVIAQEYKEWELILIDDGSSDNSKQIALRYQKDNEGRIFYHEHEGNINKGVAATRNLGISRATGKYISLLDSDDLWKPLKLKEQVEFLEMNPDIDVISEATLYWSSWFDATEKDVIIFPGAATEKKYTPPQLAWKMYPLGHGRAPCMCGIMVKTPVVRKIGGFESCFTGKDQLYEDQAFAIKLYLHTVVYFSSKCNNIYRQREDSLMHGLLQQGLDRQGRHFFLVWFKEYLKIHQIKSFRIRLLVFKSFLPYQFPATYKVVSRWRWKLSKSLAPKKAVA